MFQVARRCFLALVPAALVAFAGCSLFAPAAPKGGSDEAWAAISNGAPVRVAVYVGPGARGVGMFRWTQLVDQAPELEATYVDGAAIRAGALAKADLLVMPGGKSNLEANELGDEGQLAVRRFIEEGGSYVGTCAGAFLLMSRTGATRRERPLAIVPYAHRAGGWGGEAMLRVNYTKEAEALCGAKPGYRMERFNGGPVMVPDDPVEGADFKVMATFNANLHSYATTNKYATADGRLPTMGGGASAVAGTFGKGRVWLFAGHPEYFPSSWPSVADAFAYTARRKVTLTAPQRTRGQLAVGWWCAPGQGPAAADVARTLVRCADFDVAPMSGAEVARTALRHVDAFVVPDACETKVLDKLTPASAAMKTMVAFMDAGGTLVTWGAAAARFAPHDRLVVAKNGSDVARVLRALKNAPAPAARPAPAEKSASPVRVAYYADVGASGCAALRWLKLLSLSPDYVVTPVNASDVRNGALDQADLYIAPGGSSSAQARQLQAVGCSNVVNFVRGGGAYFGTCAGCSLALCAAPDDKATRLGLVPFTRQKSPYRGGAELEIRFTDNADLFGFKPNTRRTVRYHGGPVLNACEMVPDSDIRVVATYASDGVYAFTTNTAPTMKDHPALIAGTCGKGRLVGCSPHPESYTHTQDIIRGGLKYLTGRESRADDPQRVRGNLAVGLHAGRLRKDTAELALALYREGSVDLRAVDRDAIGQGALEHCDVYVLPHPTNESFTRDVRAFARQGGRVIAYGTEKERANVPKDLSNVSFHHTADEAKAALLALNEEK